MFLHSFTTLFTKCNCTDDIKITNITVEWVYKIRH